MDVREFHEAVLGDQAQHAGAAGAGVVPGSSRHWRGLGTRVLSLVVSGVGFVQDISVIVFAGQDEPTRRSWKPMAR